MAAGSMDVLVAVEALAFYPFASQGQGEMRRRRLEEQPLEEAEVLAQQTRVERLRVHALTNPHSPLSARIKGVVVNMPEFGRAFSCKAGSPLVKATPCQVW
jgi:endothelin-converting enzyme/putative endopeptidase